MIDIFVDFETYHDSEIGYDLKAMSMTEYINDYRFKVHGAGWITSGDQAFWTRGPMQVVNEIDWSNARVIAHNVKFDGAILAWKFGVKPAQWIDTQSMAMAVLGSQVGSFSLRSLANYFGFPEKLEMKTNGKQVLTAEEESELATYCLRDVEICAAIYNRLKEKIPASQWPIMDWTARCFIEPKLTVDVALALKTREDIEKRKAASIASVGVDPKVLSSNKQFAELLISKGVVLPMKLSPKGNRIPALAIGDPEFLSLAKTQNQEVRTLCEARIEAKKTMETKRAEKLAAVGENYPFDIVFSGATQTHRFSGGNGAGGNPQNFPRTSPLRRCIQASSGNTLVVADYSNVELRILAWLCREPRLIESIKAGNDVYSEFATQVYGRPITKADKKERQFGKAAILGLGYGMGAAKFAKTVELQTGESITEARAKEIIETYRTYYSNVPKFWQMCDKLIEFMAKGHNISLPALPAVKIGRHKITLPSGLELKYPGLRKSGREWVFDAYKKTKQIEETKLYGGKLTENLCQALAGEICKEAIQRMIKAGYPPAGQVHDELLTVCKNEELEHCTYIVRTAMETSPKWWPHIVLKAEVGAGRNWLDAKA